MSLSIDTRRISGIYALGQWFQVKINSVYLDAFELWDIEEFCPFGNEQDNRDPERRKRDDVDGYYPRQPHTAYYTMGSLYEESEPEFKSHTFENSARVRMLTPSGATGISFVDAITEEEVSFSLMECKAFRTVSKADATIACPALEAKDQ